MVAERERELRGSSATSKPFDGDAERQHHERGRREMDADGGAQVDAGAELALVQRAGGDAGERPGDREQAGDRCRARLRALADDERDAGQADRDAHLLQRAQPLVQPARDDHRRQQRLQGEDERRHAGREAPALRVVAAAEVAGVAEQPGDGDVAPVLRRAVGQRARKPNATRATTNAIA